MKKTIITIIILAALVAVAYGLGRMSNNKPVAQKDPCAADFASTILYDVPVEVKEEQVARTLLTQYLEELKKLSDCPAYQISEYQITSAGNLRYVENDFMVDMKFDVKPVNLAENTLDTPETTVDGEWIRGKQATLGIMRSPGGEDATSTTTSHYRLAI